MMSVILQEASQLLTILQGLQPPFKLDGKNIGVDYAKSARKYVPLTHIPMLLSSSEAWLIIQITKKPFFHSSGICYYQMGTALVPFQSPAQLLQLLSGPLVRYEQLYSNHASMLKQNYACMTDLNDYISLYSLSRAWSRHQNTATYKKDMYPIHRSADCTILNDTNMCSTPFMWISFTLKYWAKMGCCV